MDIDEIKESHGGFDFFSIPGSDKVYLCLKGNIVEVICLLGSTGNAMHVDVRYRHVHVEAGTSFYEYGENNLKSKVAEDLNPENYMKSKFDNNGNTL